MLSIIAQRITARDHRGQPAVRYQPAERRAARPYPANGRESSLREQVPRAETSSGPSSRKRARGGATTATTARRSPGSWSSGWRRGRQTSSRVSAVDWIGCTTPCTGGMSGPRRTSSAAAAPTTASWTFGPASSRWAGNGMSG